MLMLLRLLMLLLLLLFVFLMPFLVQLMMMLMLWDLEVAIHCFVVFPLVFYDHHFFCFFSFSNHLHSHPHWYYPDFFFFSNYQNVSHSWPPGCGYFLFFYFFLFFLSFSWVLIS